MATDDADFLETATKIACLLKLYETCMPAYSHGASTVTLGMNKDGSVSYSSTATGRGTYFKTIGELLAAVTVKFRINIKEGDKKLRQKTKEMQQAMNYLE